jgi:hypothetical protein
MGSTEDMDDPSSHYSLDDVNSMKDNVRELNETIKVL